MPNYLSTSPHVVLIRPIYSRNIGSVSRAMANMGAARLILIDPQCEINLEARQGAAGAQTRLMEATTYKSIEDFYKNEPDGLRIAFCAKHKKETDGLSLDSRVRRLVDDKQIPARPLYLIFGQEDHGLENQDINFANFVCQLPVFGEFTSFNLSHAVLLALYITNNALGTAAKHGTPAAPQNTDKFFFPEEALMTWLTTLGFEIGDRRTDVYKILKHLFLSSASTAKDFRILEVVIQQTIRKLTK